MVRRLEAIEDDAAWMQGGKVNTELNIVARRIFNRLDVDISDRRGLGNEWDQISPNVKNVEIRSAWEQIITEEIEKHIGAQQPKVNEPTKTEVTAEEWLKSTALELCRVADHFISLRKDAERVDAAAVELMDSTAKLEQENAALQARVKRLEEAGGGMAFGEGDFAQYVRVWIEAKESK
jgi:chromosome segregation ATPase